MSSAIVQPEWLLDMDKTWGERFKPRNSRTTRRILQYVTYHWKQVVCWFRLSAVSQRQGGRWCTFRWCWWIVHADDACKRCPKKRNNFAANLELWTSCQGADSALNDSYHGNTSANVTNKNIEITLKFLLITHCYNLCYWIGIKESLNIYIYIYTYISIANWQPICHIS